MQQTYIYVRENIEGWYENVMPDPHTCTVLRVPATDVPVRTSVRVQQAVGGLFYVILPLSVHCRLYITYTFLTFICSRFPQFVPGFTVSLTAKDLSPGVGLFSYALHGVSNSFLRAVSSSSLLSGQCLKFASVGTVASYSAVVSSLQCCHSYRVGHDRIIAIVVHL